MSGPAGPEFGLERGKVFPAEKARSLLNPARRLVQSPRRTIGAIGLHAGALVLEIGCGPGFFSPTLVRAVDGGQAVLLDLQMEMLEMARERAGTAACVQASGARLPFAAECFDAVFIATVLGEIPDQAGCIADARRILRPGGTLAIAETRRDSDFVPLPQLRTLVEPQGFEFAGRRGIRWQFVARFRAV